MAIALVCLLKSDDTSSSCIIILNSSELQYYNADFTEFDLEIKNYYFKISTIGF